MLKTPKGRGHKDAAKRFCVECGLNAPKGTTRYATGAEISMGGVMKIICSSCKSFKLIDEDIYGNKVRACVDCQTGSNQQARLSHQREQERRLAIKRETSRLERERRRARGRETGNGWWWKVDYSIHRLLRVLPYLTIHSV